MTTWTFPSTPASTSYAKAAWAAWNAIMPLGNKALADAVMRSPQWTRSFPQPPKVFGHPIQNLIEPPTTPITTKLFPQPYREPIPWWRNDVSATLNGPAFLSIDRGGQLYGHTKDAGAPVQSAFVSLFYGPRKIFIRTVLSAADGSFSFVGLDRSDSNYFIVAQKPAHYAQVFDVLTPA